MQEFRWLQEPLFYFRADDTHAPRHIRLHETHMALASQDMRSLVATPLTYIRSLHTPFHTRAEPPHYDTQKRPEGSCDRPVEGHRSGCKPPTLLTHTGRIQAALSLLPPIKKDKSQNAPITLLTPLAAALAPPSYALLT